jgi:predicted dithiol-disulfide oxidoreductase (DUF899 family)
MSGQRKARKRVRSGLFVPLFDPLADPAVVAPTAMTEHHTGTREEWRTARVELLELEKEHTRRADELARRRRELPWVRIDKPYEFETEEGTKTLAELFDGRSQLIVYHFMFGPDWDAGCEGCSLVADHFDGGMVHLNQRDVTMVCVSRTSLEKINAYKRRMGWRFTWVSSLNTDFNDDFGVSYTAEQQANGAEYNFRWEDDPGDEGHGLSSFALPRPATRTFCSAARASGGGAATTSTT